jgi:hypothetical protein
MVEEPNDLPVTYLSNTEGPHNKWYVVVQLPQNGRSIVGYGKHGKEGTWREKSLAEGKKLIWQKTHPGKGYRSIGTTGMMPPALNEMVTQVSRLLGDQCDILQGGNLRAGGSAPPALMRQATLELIDTSWADNW